MKKIIIATMLAITTAAFASDVTVSSTRDTKLDKNGVTVGTSVGGYALSATKVEDAYNRFAVGKDFSVTKVGPVAVTAGVAGVYQDSQVGRNGFGVSVGAKATYPLTKNLDLVGGVNRFFGQERIDNFNGTNVSVGLTAKF